MVKESQSPVCSSVSGSDECCCKVDAVVSVDDRGQMVLPKEIRDKVGIQAGDKLAVVSMEQGGKPCCISLIKVEELTEMVKSMLGPVMKEIF